MKNSERLSRLQELHRIMYNHKKTFPDVQFYIGTWCRKQIACLSAYGCGTAACALGSAGLHKPFRKLGLRSDIKDHSVIYRQGDDFHDGAWAGKAFFGINLKESEHLFLPQSYDKRSTSVTPRMVAKRVKDLITKYSKPRTKPKKKRASAC